VKEASSSFLEKKNQKTFATLSRARRRVRDSQIKVFASFFKKKSFLFFVLLASPALADQPPAVQPQRDVDVTYKVPVAGQGNMAILQRLRFSAALRRQRVDLPTSGNWMMLDFANHTMAMVRDQSKEIVELPAPANAALPGAGAGFTRQGDATVAGLACTEWRTHDTRGQETVACYTADGVLLRARNDSGTLMEAVQVNYGALPEAVFALPDGYTRQKP
jgi:hypothetical protein